MLFYLLASDQYSTWEHRVGSYPLPCNACRQQAWQLVFRIYQTKGTPAAPGTPYGFAMNERFQTRCSTCGVATLVNHPTTWVHSVAGWVQEWGPVTPASPQYVALAYPAQ
ncbi:MAG TPA: hypothetical protein VLM85_28445 [Polyangiaceae bacterium]|nr:hypothetical protein [Polyangiaceae bacterium]